MTWFPGLLLVPLAVVLAGCSSEADGSGVDGGGAGRIAFVSSRDGDFDIFVMDADGGDLVQLTRNESSGRNERDDHQPAWSSDGERIALTSTRDHPGDSFTSQELYVMNADGSAQRRLTENAFGESRPRWSPDGRGLAFVRLSEEREPRFELVVLDEESSEERILVSQEQPLSGLDWAPDGSRIAFTSCDAAFADCDIWTVDAEGADPRRLTDSPGSDGDAAWSPDGSTIAFVSDRDRHGECFFRECTGFNGEIYVMNADGSEQVRVTDDPGDDGSPAWSPDGSQLAFAGLRDVVGAVDGEDYELYVMEADGVNLRPLTENEGWDLEPDWR